MKTIYYIIKTIFYLVAICVMVQLFTDYKADRQKKQAAKTEVIKILNGLQK